MSLKIMFESTLSPSIYLGSKKAEEVTKLLEEFIGNMDPKQQEYLSFFIFGTEKALDKHYNHERG